MANAYSPQVRRCSYCPAVILLGNYMVLIGSQENPVFLDQKSVINIKMLLRVLSTTAERAKQEF